MDDDDYNLIYGVVHELQKNVLKTITQKSYLDEKGINSITRCNIGAIFRLLKFAYPRIDPGDVSIQSHIFQDPPRQSDRITFITNTKNGKIKQLTKLKK